MSLVIMRGISGSGKSTVARLLFSPHQILSSDDLRVEMYGTMNVPPSASGMMWSEFHRRLEYRCQFHVPTVVDATNLTQKSIKEVVKLAKRYNVKYVIASITPDLDRSTDVLLKRKRGELAGAVFDTSVLDDQLERYNNNTAAIKNASPNEYFEGNNCQVTSRILEFMNTRNTYKATTNTFIIGDIHGKFAKLFELLEAIPKNASIYSVGDLIDRGEDSIRAVKLLMGDPRFKGYAYGNHDINFIHESWGKMPCRSKDRQETHDIVNAAPVEVREKFVERLLSGKPFIVLKCDGYKDVLITHTGVSRFDYWNTSLHDVVSDRINSKDQGIAGIRDHFTQVHGHRSWEYTADFYGDIVNVDSGCYESEILTAFNPFTREAIHV